MNAKAVARTFRVHQFIRKLHLWIGAWGAMAAILFGFTGFIQNHRAVLKIPQGESTELSSLDLPVPENVRASPESLLAWLRDDQHVTVDTVRVQPGRGAEFNGRKVPQGARWMFMGGNARNTTQAEYRAGGDSIAIKHTHQSPLEVLSRLHKGVGGGVAWILLSDSFALAMVALGITGLLLWSRGRSASQLVFSIVGAAVVVLTVIVGSAIV